MGQRHHVFAIARVSPHGSTTPRYRCVAAIHHQWCYGSLPLWATRRFLTLVKQKENSEIVLAELRSIQGKYGRWRMKPKLPKVPCPFISLLLALSWTVDLSDPEVLYSSGTCVSVLSADLGSNSGNDDGISVIDVTDPSSPAYCFVSTGTLSTPAFVPLSATAYGRAYYPAPESGDIQTEKSKRDEEFILPPIATLAGERMVELWMLEEAWPAEYQTSLQRNPRSSAESDESNAVASLVPSLADMSTGLAVEHAIQSGETGDIEEMMWMPDRASGVKSALLKLSEIPDNAIGLLLRLLGLQTDKTTTALDLSPYNLSAEQIVKIVSEFESVEALNVSHNPHVTTATVQDVLLAVPKLKRLVMMDCPSLTAPDLTKLLEEKATIFYNLEALIHPSLLVLDPHESYPNSFSFISSDGTHSSTARTVPFFSLSGIIDGLIGVFDCLYNTEDPLTALDMVQSDFVVAAALSATARKPDQAWGERSVVVSPYFSLDGFSGQGWVFFLNYRPFTEAENSWAFLKFHQTSNDDSPNTTAPTGQPPFEIFDLRSFLQAISKVKAPPPEELIVKLEEKLQLMEENRNMRLMKEETVLPRVQSISMYASLYRRGTGNAIW